MRFAVRALRAITLAVTFGLIASQGSALAAGALAVGQCAAYGYAYDYARESDARSAALKKCKNGNCEVVATINRGCVAFAIDGRNACGPHGYAVAPRLGLASNIAVKYCSGYGGKDCVIRAWACDSGKPNADTTGSVGRRR